MAQANLAAFNAGWSFGETTELLDVQYRVAAATDVPPGTYRNVNGTTALALGLIAASVRSGSRWCWPATRSRRRPSCCTSSRATPSIGVSTIQAEDEIAAAGMALGASFGGALGVTATSGPGMDLKAETIGLAVMLGAADGDRRRAARRPVDRDADQDRAVRPAAWRSTAATASRRCRSSRPAPPADASTRRFEAARIAIRYRTPVILLSDTFLASSSEPWRMPRSTDLPEIDPEFATAPAHNGRRPRAGRSAPYSRDDHLARPWAIPGTPGLEHRIGGLEKADGSGNISYDGANHERMTELRAAKVAAIAERDPAAAGRH